MIVLDASAVVELLTNGPLAGAIGRELASRDEPLAAPHLIDIEVLSAVRRMAAAKQIDSRQREEILRGLESLPAHRYAHTPLVRRIWDLRNNFTAYDATYIALAEATGSVLFTCDEKLRAGHRAPVVLFTY